jgi:protein TonB
VEEGDANLLTTAHWRHAPFFQRVRRQVAQNWHPQVAVARHDPGALTYGHRDRRTIVRVVLNDDGSLERVYVIQGCGADFLDDEAVRAVQRGAPFPNPPQGLVDQRTGHAVFSFEFNLTFSAPPLLRLGR